jgi:hypothetical protein
MQFGKDFPVYLPETELLIHTNSPPGETHLPFSGNVLKINPKFEQL